MATGTGNLPNPSMAFTPLDQLPASDLNKVVANINALASGTGVGDAAVKAHNIDFTTFPAAQQAWIAPTLVNSWSNLGIGFDVAGYMKDSLGFVHLNGIITGGSYPSTAFTLPAGYRPALSLNLATSSNAAFGEIQVLNTGVITAAVGSSWISLSGLTFKAE